MNALIFAHEPKTVPRPDDDRAVVHRLVHLSVARRSGSSRSWIVLMVFLNGCAATVERTVAP